MAQMLDLTSSNGVDDGITRETKRRIWWTCFICDIWSSGGGSLARQLDVAEHQPRLPLEEVTFIELQPGEADLTDAAWKAGIWSHMVGMIELYKEIQDLLRYLVATTQWDEDFIESTVHKLAVRLLAFEDRLAPEFDFSAENVARHARRGTGRLFTGFHLGYQYYCMINRLNAFLRSCVSSNSNNTHRFDKWMVKFLQEYSMTLDEKEESVETPSAHPDMYEYGFNQRSRTMQGVISTFGGDAMVNY
ncbi:hypothetical protein ABW20_dc0100676 [Dactylellina cionopaga]|nr:hypothetical protein ABW20_dc0100676 [Dactylellina cionopaga]